MRFQYVETNNNHFSHAPKKEKRVACELRRCNLCNQKFLALSKFERFCLTCKKENELYHYHETLPSLGEDIALSMS